MSRVFMAPPRKYRYIQWTSDISTTPRCRAFGADRSARAKQQARVAVCDQALGLLTPLLGHLGEQCHQALFDAGNSGLTLDHSPWRLAGLGVCELRDLRSRDYCEHSRERLRAADEKEATVHTPVTRPARRRLHTPRRGRQKQRRRSTAGARHMRAGAGDHMSRRHAHTSHLRHGCAHSCLLPTDRATVAPRGDRDRPLAANRSKTTLPPQTASTPEAREAGLSPLTFSSSVFRAQVRARACAADPAMTHPLEGPGPAPARGGTTPLQAIGPCRVAAVELSMRRGSCGGRSSVKVAAGAPRGADGRSVLREHVRAEGEALGLLDDLLVHVERLHAQDHLPRLLVDAGVELCVRHHGDDPLLGRKPRHAKFSRERRQVDALVDAAVRLEDVQPRVRHKVGLGVAQEEVGIDERGACRQPRLRLVKVGAGVQVIQEAGDRVSVYRALHGDGANELLDQVPAARVGHDRHGRVAQQVRAAGLDGVEVPVGEEEVADQLPPRGVVAKQK
eukprot:scaffold14825_cov123-Isochrysis_galbana.AAC.3